MEPNAFSFANVHTSKADNTIGKKVAKNINSMTPRVIFYWLRLHAIYSEKTYFTSPIVSFRPLLSSQVSFMKPSPLEKQEPECLLVFVTDL